MIYGLSERRRLPRAGRIKLGVLVQEPGKKPYPRATAHFVVPDEVAKVLGTEEPTALPVMLPHDNPDVVFPQALRMYRSAGLWCSGDGRVARRWDEQGTLKELACPCPFLESGECGPSATLHVFLPDVPGVGVYTITTGNKTSIVSLNSGLEQFQAMFGGLCGIPFTLKLEPQDVQRWDDKKQGMVKTRVYVMRLDSTLTLREIVQWRQQLGKPVEALMPAPDVGHEDPEPIAEEASFTDAAADEPIEWTLEQCFATALAVGIDATTYGKYLTKKYGTSVSDLTDYHLNAEGDFWASAIVSTLARDTAKSVILATVKKP